MGVIHAYGFILCSCGCLVDRICPLTPGRLLYCGVAHSENNTRLVVVTAGFFPLNQIISTVEIGAIEENIVSPQTDFNI